MEHIAGFFNESAEKPRDCGVFVVSEHETLQCQQLLGHPVFLLHISLVFLLHISLLGNNLVLQCQQLLGHFIGFFTTHFIGFLLHISLCREQFSKNIPGKQRS